MVTRIRRRPVDVLSLVLLIGMHVSCAFVFFVPFAWWLVGLAAAGYVLRMFAITAGYHRYFSHRAFKTSRAFQLVLATLGTASMQNGPLWWASWHRYHHKHADTPLDVHSPRYGGFWNAHLGWVLADDYDRFDASLVKDLVRYPELVFLERHKWLPIIGYALVCFAIGGLPAVVWGFVVSTVVLFHCTLFINSLAHVWGTQRYVTRDQSRNNVFLAVLTLGEGWHNNHHHYMSSARQGFRWWELDVTYYVLAILRRLHVIWDVRVPPTTASSMVVAKPSRLLPLSPRSRPATTAG